MMDPREKNALMNKFARECSSVIASPFRVKMYCEFRIKGKTHEQALELAKSRPHPR